MAETPGSGYQYEGGQDFYEFIDTLVGEGMWPEGEPFPPGYTPPESGPVGPQGPTGGGGGAGGAQGGSGFAPEAGAGGGGGGGGGGGYTPPAPSGGFLSNIPGVSGILDIAAKIREAVSPVVGAAFDGATAIIGALKADVAAILDYAIPTVAELALGVANAAQGALDFIGDNLTDAADLGGALAAGIASPFSDLLEWGGEMLWNAIVRLLQFLGVGLAGAQARIFGAVQLERLI